MLCLGPRADDELGPTEAGDDVSFPYWDGVEVFRLARARMVYRKWDRIYSVVAPGRGITLLLVQRVNPGAAGDLRWTAVDNARSRAAAAWTSAGPAACARASARGGWVGVRGGVGVGGAGRGGVFHGVPR